MAEVERAKPGVETKAEEVRTMLRQAENLFEALMRPLPEFAQIIMEKKHASKLAELGGVGSVFLEAWRIADKIGDRALAKNAANGYHKVSGTINWLRYGLQEEERDKKQGVPLYS